MIPFKPFPASQPALHDSPMLRAAMLMISYIEANGPVGLTASRALKRYFVEWAAEAFTWQYYTAPDLYAVNKVLNEPDFPPLVILHEVLLSAKLATHRKGNLHLTPLAARLKSDPAGLWSVLARHLLCKIDHSKHTRYGDKLVGTWDIFLNVINVEAQHGVSEDRLMAVLFAGSKGDVRYDDIRQRAALYLHVLRPLCWIGLLSEVRVGQRFDRQEHFFKTPLWHVALKLETDSLLKTPMKH